MNNHVDPFAALVTPPANLEPTMESVHASVREIGESMMRFDDTTSDTLTVRTTLMNKIMPAVMNIDFNIDGGTDSEQYSVKTKLLSEFKGLLNDIDSSARNHVSMKLKQKDSETASQRTLNAAEFLASISLTENVPIRRQAYDNNQIELSIQRSFDSSDSVILDSELETGGNMLPDSSKKDD